MCALWREGTGYSALPCWEKVLVAEGGGRVRVSGHGVTCTDPEVERGWQTSALPLSPSQSQHLPICT